MHRDSAHAFKVGLMVAVGLLILATLILVSGDIQPFRPRYTLTVTFNYVAGLEVNSPVRLAGMEVGEVKKMHVRDGKIEVVVQIDKEARIHKDTKATINSMGLIGEKYVALTMGSDTEPYLKNGATITGQDPVSIGEMLSKGEAVVEKVEGAVKSLDRILSKAEIADNIEKILKNIETFTDDLKGLLEENREDISSGLKDFSKTSKEFRETIRESRVSVKEVSSRLKSILRELDEGLEGKGKDIDEIITSLKRASNGLALAMNSLQDTAQRVEKGEGTAGKILFDEEIAEDLGAAIKDLRELAADLRAHPWKLMKKK